MNLTRRVLSFIQRFWREVNRSYLASEPQMIATGWDKYAREWKPAGFPVLPGRSVQYLGDEWTAEDALANVTTTYGLDPNIVDTFDDYINQHLLTPFLPPCAPEGLEIGPGGGRLTALLVPRTKLLHLADASEAMLGHLKQRFLGVSDLRYYHIDGITLPQLRPASLDYVIAFDVFVHFEPRMIYWYLRQIARLLAPGGTGIIHYANISTPIGWQQFMMDLESNLHRRVGFASFGVMCPELMARFLETLKLEVIATDIGIIPRDAIAVFRKPVEDTRGS
jgi:SAM-dependent methyltransferase